MKVTMSDVRRAKMCSRGARIFCVRHGISWSEFLKHGVDVKIVEDTGDAMARRVVEVARGQ